MRAYKISIIATFVINVISLALSLVLHFSLQDFIWENIMLAIFGSGMILFVQSIIFYFLERKKVVNEFFMKALLITKRLGNYSDYINTSLNYNQIIFLGDDLSLLMKDFDVIRKLNNETYFFCKKNDRILLSFSDLLRPMTSDLLSLLDAIHKAKLQIEIKSETIQKHFVSFLSLLFENGGKHFEAISIAAHGIEVIIKTKNKLSDKTEQADDKEGKE